MVAEMGAEFPPTFSKNIFGLIKRMLAGGNGTSSAVDPLANMTTNSSVKDYAVRKAQYPGLAIKNTTPLPLDDVKSQAANTLRQLDTLLGLGFFQFFFLLLFSSFFCSEYSIKHIFFAHESSRSYVFYCGQKGHGWNKATLFFYLLTTWLIIIFILLC